MRTLTSSLLAAQQASSRTPCIELKASNKLSGAVNLRWTRLYTGSEAEYRHALVMPADGSMIRLRITPAGDSHKLYRQRVSSPAPGVDFSQWTYLNQYSVAGVAACSNGAEVVVFWIRSTGEINSQKSLDYGSTWQTPVFLGYSPTGDVGGLAAASKPDGDLVLFLTDMSDLYYIRRVSGSWQSRVKWDKSTGLLTGVAAYYGCDGSGDWKLLLTGQADDGDYKVWSLIFGDGDEVAAGSWSALKDMASAPLGGNFEYSYPFLDKPDTFRCFFVENFSGSEAYNRPFFSHVLPAAVGAAAVFLDNRWREPLPFASQEQYSLAMAHTAAYAWLSTPCGVWRAALAEESLDLSPDILSLKGDLAQDSGKLLVELRNDSGQYSSPGVGDLTVLDQGCQLDFSPGYVTPAGVAPQGAEYSEGLSFMLQGWEHVSSPGKAGLLLYAADGWEALERWTARYQLRWNQPDQYGDPVQEASVKEILAQVLARAGIRLVVSSQSSTIAGFYPDFTIHAGDNGRSIVTRLLSFVPDVLFLEGLMAYLLNPLSTDSSVYSYGPMHSILEGRYRQDSWRINRVQVEGLDRRGPMQLVVESFDWDEIQRCGDRLEMLEDLNVATIAQAQERGAAYLRQAEIESVSGFIRVPVNCGQQLYDVIAVTDPRAGLSAAARRVLGIALSYQPKKGEYEQVLKLGGV